MRFYVMPVFPYTIVYQRRDEDTVEIVAVPTKSVAAFTGNRAVVDQVLSCPY